MKKQYYKGYMRDKIKYYHTDTETMKNLMRISDVIIIPIGTKKPKNVSRETIIEI